MATGTKRQLKTIDDDDDPGDFPGGPVWGASSGNQLAVQEEEDEPQTDVDRVAELIRQSDGVGRAQVKVYKIENGASVFCESYSPSDFEAGDYGMLRDNFGPGKFKIILYGIHPVSEKFGILTRGEITIAEIRKSESRMQNPIAQNNGLEQMIATIQQGQQNMLDALISIKQTPPKDPMEEMTKMLSMMSMMRQAMGMDQSNKSPISDIVAAVRELRSVSEEFSPGKESAEPNLVSMLPQVLDLVKTGMQAQQRQPQQPEQQAFPSIAIPASLQSNPTPIQTEEDEDVNIKEMFALRKNLSDLLAMAEQKKTPEEGAQYVYDALPDDFVDLMADEKWFDMLSLIEPKAHVYREWLTETRAKAIALFEVAEAETPE